MDARNVLMIVTRWYGGIHLGPDSSSSSNTSTGSSSIHLGPDSSGSGLV